MNEQYRYFRKAASAGIVPLLVFGALAVPAVSGHFGITPLTAFAEEETGYPGEPVGLGDETQTISLGENCQGIWADGILTVSGTGAIDDEAFYGNALSDETDTIIIGEGITSIGESAFAETAVQYLYLPDSLEWIGSFAFSDSMELRTVIYQTTTPINIADNTIFSGCDWIEYIYLKDGYLDSFSGRQGLPVLGLPAAEYCCVTAPYMLSVYGDALLDRMAQYAYVKKGETLYAKLYEGYFAVSDLTYNGEIYFSSIEGVYQITVSCDGAIEIEAVSSSCKIYIQAESHLPGYLMAHLDIGYGNTRPDGYHAIFDGQELAINENNSIGSLPRYLSTVTFTESAKDLTKPHVLRVFYRNAAGDEITILDKEITMAGYLRAILDHPEYERKHEAVKALLNFATAAQIAADSTARLANTVLEEEDRIDYSTCSAPVISDVPAFNRDALSAAAEALGLEYYGMNLSLQDQAYLLLAFKGDMTEEEFKQHFVIPRLNDLNDKMIYYVVRSGDYIILKWGGTGYDYLNYSSTSLYVDGTSVTNICEMQWIAAQVNNENQKISALAKAMYALYEACSNI